MDGICALCLKARGLRRSHLIPRAAYQRIRSADGSPRDPIRLGGGTAVPSSEQVTAHLLCSDCEQLLSRQGEKHVLEVCRQTDGTFPLRSAVTDLPVVCSAVGLGSAVRLPAVMNETATALTHFACGIAWKRSAGRWNLHGMRERKQILGPFEESLRKFLLGDAEFPEAAELVVEVITDRWVPGVLCYPTPGRSGKVTVHRFGLLGLAFQLVVSRHMPSWARERSITSSDIILLRPFMATAIYPLVAEVVARSEPKGKLADNQWHS